MGLLELFVLAVGLSMDAFAVSVCKGLSMQKIRVKHMVLAGVWFGGFQALMPLIGFFLGTFFEEFISSFSHWVAFVLLAFIGINMIREAFGEAEEVDASMDVMTMLLMAIATSIDALAVGASFAFLKVAIIPAVILIGCTTFCFSFAGVKIGSLFGTKWRFGSELAGGLILIGIGVKILLEGLGVL